MSATTAARHSIAAALAAVMIFGFSPQTAALSAQPVRSLTLPLPKPLYETDFNVSADAMLDSGSGPRAYALRGPAFLYDDGKTYIPVRDVAEAFGLSVTYNPSDRYIRLSDGNSDFIIGPESWPFKGGSAWVAFADGQQVSAGDGGYVTRNGVSYAQLRTVMEYFKFQVGYDPASRRITVSGNYLEDAPVLSAFSDDMRFDAVAMAFMDYESARAVQFSGAYVPLGETTPQKFEVSMTITRTEIATNINYDIRIAGSKQRYTAFASAAAGAHAASESYGSNAPWPNGAAAWADGHPYSRIGASSHSGIGKYTKKPSDHILIESTDAIDRYQIAREIAGTGAVTFAEYVEISKDTGKLNKITTISNGVVISNFTLTY
jgi:hypothetical protein